MADAHAELLQGTLDLLILKTLALGPELASDELIGVGMAPFFYLPHTLFVAEHGLKQSIASFPRPDSHASISEGWG